MNTFKYIVLFLFLYLLVIFISKYPVYYAVKNTPEGFFSTGQASWFDPWDVNVYVSSIKYGQDHGVMLPNLYSTEPDKPAFIYPIYTLTGMLFPHVQAFVLYHTMTFITTFILLFTMYWFAYRILKNFHIPFRYYALAIVGLAMLGRGVGWAVPQEQVQPADLYIASFTLRTTIQRPHEAIGMALYFASMFGFYLYILKENKRYFYISLVANLLLILFYPYYIIMFFTVNLMFILLSHIKHSRKKIIHLIVNVGVTGLFTLLYFFHLYFSSFNSAISENLPNVTLTSLITGYGIFFVTLLISIATLRKNTDQKSYMIIWVMIGFVFSYLPFGFSRFYLRGLFLPLAFLTIYLYLQALVTKKYYLKLTALVIFAAFAFPSVLYIFTARLDPVNKNNPWYYLPIEYRRSFDVLEHAPKDGVLSTYTMGNMIPAYTGKKVYIGHTLQTPYFPQRQKEVEAFYAGTISDDEAYKFLKKNNINYVYYSHFSHQIGQKVMEYKFLNPIYFTDSVVIYEVKNES